MTVAQAIIADLTDADLDQLADLLADRLAARLPAVRQKEGGWLSSELAAEYLACSRSRIHDLVQIGKLSPRRDGRRLLFRRSDLDAYLEASA